MLPCFTNYNLGFSDYGIMKYPSKDNKKVTDNNRE